jgi:hypothetical protein
MLTIVHVLRARESIGRIARIGGNSEPRRGLHGDERQAVVRVHGLSGLAPLKTAAFGGFQPPLAADGKGSKHECKFR